MTKRRILIVIAAGLGVVVVIVGGLIASLFVGLQGLQEDFELNGVRLVVDGFVGVGLVEVAPGEVILIDAGVDPEGTAILAGLSRRGLAPEAVTAIFLTHGHSDHSAAVPVFPNAQVVAMEEEADLVAGRVRPSSPMGRVIPSGPTGIEVTRRLSHLENVPVGETELRAYHMPGHTEGSAAYLVNGVLFLGDEANASRDGQVKAPPWVVTDDVARATASLVQLEGQLRAENAPVQAIAFAHSGVLTDGLAPLTSFAERNR